MREMNLMKDERKTKAQLIEELVGLRQRVIELETAETERKQEEEENRILLSAVQQEKIRLSVLIDSITDEVWFADTKGRLTIANPSALREFGIDSGDIVEVEKFAKSLEVFRPDGSLRPVEEAPPLRALSGEVVRFQEEIVRTPASGELRTRQVSSAPVRDSTGSIVGAVSVVRDITEHRKMEREMQLRNQISSIFLTIADDEMYGALLPIVLGAVGSRYGVFGYIDEEGAFICPSMTRDIWDKCQVPGKSITFPRDTWGDSIWARSIKEGKTLYSNQSFPVPEGHIPIQRALMVPIIFHQEVIGLFEVANKEADYDEDDIQMLETIAEIVAPLLSARLQGNRYEKESKQAEEKLRESEGKYRDLFENAEIGMYSTKLDGTAVLAVNQKLAEILGMSKEEILSNPAFLRWEDPADREEMVRWLTQEGSVLDYEIRLVTKSGQVKTCLVSGKVFEDKGIFEGSLVDITDRKQVEEDLRLLNLELDQRVTERTAELKRTNERLQNEIAERKEAEETLSKTNARLEFLLTASPSVIYTSEPSGDYGATFISENIRTQFGYEPREFTDNPEFWADHIHPEDAPRVFTELSHLFEEGHLTFEYRFLHKDGSYRWVRDELNLVRDSQGKPLEIIGSWIDITEGKRAEAALQESEERYRLIFEQAADSIVLVDAKTGALVEFNDKAQQNLGYSREEFERLKIPNFEIIESAEEVAKHIEKIIREGSDSFETKHRTKDGEIRDILVNSRFIFIRGRGFIQSMWSDITERKRAEQALQDSRERLLKAQRRAKMGFLEWNMKTNEMYWSDEIYRLYRVDPQEVKNADLMDVTMQLVHPDDKEFVEKNLDMALRGVKEYDIDHRKLLPDGEVIWVHAQAELVRDADGNPESLLGTVVDITARKRAEETVKEHAAQLEAANQELEAFAYSVSHDLRAPLRGIDGFSQALLEDCADELDTQGRDYLQRVRANCQHMGQLIDDLLKLSRLTRREMRRETVDLSVLAERITTRLQQAQPERQAEFVMAQGLIAQGDRVLLMVALENLLDNAWKFTGKHPSARIEFGDTAVEGQPAYFVRDDGVGFDMAYVDKLFQPFQRLHAVEEFPGTGIGLATVQRVIHRHGGRVWAEGAVEQGATVYFILP